MKLMTWNIWGGKYLNDVIEVIKNENPDILSLQEVKEVDGENHAKIIGKKLGYEVIYCKAFSTNRHSPPYDLGNAILSRVPIVKSSCHFLSELDEYQENAETEPRTVVEVVIEKDNQELTLLNTHLSRRDDFKETQFRLNQLENLLKVTRDTNCILMGDFNSLPSSQIVKKISEKLVNTDQALTEFSQVDEETGEKVRIDYIFVSNDLTFSDFKIIETKASDHYPLSVTL